MTVYSYSRVLVWDNLGGSVKVARNQRVDVTDPATGLVAAGLTVKGQPVPYVTSDGDGHVTFASTMGLVRLTSQRGFWQDVESPDLRSGAVQAGIDAAAAAASAATSAAAATGAATAAATQATAAAKSQIDASAAAAASSATAAQNSANLVGSPAASAIDTYLGSGSSVAVRKGDLILDPKNYGAVGDGVADDTTAWQNCVNAASGGATIDGFGRTYLVSSVVFKSNLTVQRANFKTKSGTGNFRSPVTLGATSSSTVVSNVTFRKINVDGNRVGQTALLGSEDGGCHGFRFLGPIQNVLVEDCSAVNCASDGLEIYSANSPLVSYSTGISSNIRVVRTRLNNNRRHGASADSVTDLAFVDCELKGNGLNADGSITPGAANDGAKGSIMPTVGGLYGNGIDVEEYNVKTYAGNIRYTGCTMTGNAKQGALFYAGGNLASDANWVTRTGFTIEGGTYDAGISAASTGYAIEFTPLGTNKSLGWYYDDVQIEGARINGLVLLRAVKTARHGGGRVTNNDANYIGNADTVQFLRINPIDRGSKRYNTNAATVQYSTSADIWVGAGDFVPTTGAPAFSTISRHPCLILSDAAIKRAAATVVFPADWERATITAYWAAAVGTGGAINIGVAKGSLNGGTTLASPVSSQGVFPTDAGLNVVVATVLDTNAPVSGQMTLEVIRDGTAGGDTLAGDCAFLGLRAVRTV